jgi:tetratricopeptide (TPR) repeat protein
MRLTLVICLAAATAAYADPADALARAQKLVLHARASAARGNASQTIAKVEEAVEILERELRTTHPVDSEEFRKLAETYKRTNHRLLEGYRNQGRDADARRRVDAILETLEGLISQAHSYGTDLFVALGSFYHGTMGRLAQAAAREGDQGRLDQSVDRFLDTLEGLLEHEHPGNEQWYQGIAKTYVQTVQKVAKHYADAGRKDRVLALVIRARGTLADVLGEDHQAIRNLDAKRAELEGR